MPVALGSTDTCLTHLINRDISFLVKHLRVCTHAHAHTDTHIHAHACVRTHTHTVLDNRQWVLMTDPINSHHLGRGPIALLVGYPGSLLFLFLVFWP